MTVDVCQERSVAIMTAYFASAAHTSTSEEDVAGIALFDLLDEISEALMTADSASERNAAQNEMNRTFINILGVLEAFIDYLDFDIDPFDMIRDLVEAQREQ